MSDEENPRKRIRLEQTNVPSTQLDKDTEKEIRSGITAFVSQETPGFSGVLKQRFTDFLVNEILPSGEVLHLKGIAVPVPGGRRKNGEAKSEKSEKSEASSDKPTQGLDSVEKAKSNEANKSEEVSTRVCKVGSIHHFLTFSDIR
jgi:tRNA pseudouridine13 synthase